MTVAYGARCSWWDSKEKAASKDGTPTGLPCCPHCGGVLFEISEAAWWEQAHAYDGFETGPDEYCRFLNWSRGKCFGPMFAAVAAWEREGSP